jgi:hypothetical protein
MGSKFSDIVDRAQVGVLNTRRDAGLAVEAFDDRGAVLGSEVWHLESDAAAESGILDKIDRAHPP